MGAATEQPQTDTPPKAGHAAGEGKDADDAGPPTPGNGVVGHGVGALGGFGGAEISDLMAGRPVSRDGRSVALGLAAKPLADLQRGGGGLQQQQALARPTSAKRAERRGKPTTSERRGYAKFMTPAQRKAARAKKSAAAVSEPSPKEGGTA